MMSRYEDDFEQFREKSERFKKETELSGLKNTSEFWVGTASIQLIGTLISGITVLFWMNKFTLWILAIMTLFSVINWTIAYLTTKDYAKKIKSLD
jgi:hypothetical protein